MPGGRPSRGAKVVYREVGSDDSDYEYDDEVYKVVTVERFEDNSDDEDYKPGDNGATPDITPKVSKLQQIQVHLFLPFPVQVVYPPLSPLQLRLRKVCRLGDKDLLQTFLADNPGVELDVKDPEGGTILTETATKTAQFCDIAHVLIEAGAGLEVSDSLGNTPLHNAVLYFPSTQRTVDLLLQQGASVISKNNDGVMPEGLAEDKDLKLVLKELRKAAGRKKCISTSVTLYLNSPDLRKKVFDQVLMEERLKQKIIVRFNSPPILNSPGLLKRKQKIECLDDSINERQSKRIRWDELDSAGREIDPQFSSEEECGASQDEDEETREEFGNSSGIKADEEEDVIIVHNDVKKGQSLESDTELCLVKPSEEEKKDGDENEDIKTCFIPESITLGSSKEEMEMMEIKKEIERDSEETGKGAMLNAVSLDSINYHTTLELPRENAQSGNPSMSFKFYDIDIQSLNQTDESYDEGAISNPPATNDGEQNKSAASKSPYADEEEVTEDIDEDDQTINESNEDGQTNNETNESNLDSSDQFVRKCSQGFGFFVS